MDIQIDGLPTREMAPEYQSAKTLVGVDGNAYAIMAVVDRGLREDGAPKEYRDAVQTDMMSGDYDHLLQVAVRYTKG